MDEKAVQHLTTATENISQACESVFQLSTGALALSITFKGSLVNDTTVHLWILAVAWISLSIVPVSYVVLKLINADESMFLCDFFQNPDNENQQQKISSFRELPRKIKWLIMTKAIFHLFLFSGFIVGILCFLAFAIKNINS